MTQEQRESNRQQLANAKLQKELSTLSTKIRFRERALDAAVSLRPFPGRIAGDENIKYDVIKESQKIYAWLIKDLK